MTDPKPYPGEAVAHTVVTHGADGTVHVQQLEAAHVVPDSVRVIDVPPGVSVVLRHVGAGK